MNSKEYLEAMERIGRLLDEADELEQTAGQIQSNIPSTFSEKQLRDFRSRYLSWYSSALACLPEDAKTPFAKEYEGGTFFAGIQKFITTPTKINPLFSQTAAEGPLPSLYWLYQFETAFQQRFVKQQGILMEARSRFTVLSTISDRPIPGLLGGSVGIEQEAPVGRRDTGTNENEPIAQGKDTVFIAHGHSPLYLQVSNFIREDLKLSTVYFETNDHTSEHISHVLGQMLDSVAAAVIVMTGEIETKHGERLARQNVVHEAGLFQAELGFDKVVLLKETGVENFSNAQGIVYIPFDAKNIDGSFYALRRFFVRQKLVQR